MTHLRILCPSHPDLSSQPGQAPPPIWQAARPPRGAANRGGPRTAASPPGGWRLGGGGTMALRAAAACAAALPPVVVPPAPPLAALLPALLSREEAPPPPPPPPSPSGTGAGTAAARRALARAGTLLSLLLPPWLASRPVRLALILILAVPLLALLEAGLVVWTYRATHLGGGGRPVPIVPCRGSVTVRASRPPRGGEEEDGTRGDADGRDGSRGAAAAAASAVSAAEVDVEVEVEAPLRLLVVGDSLAAGVGTAESCVPVLPGAIAEALGRELVEMELELLRPEPEKDRMRPGTGTERTVRWTAVGEAGASAGWVARTLGLGGDDGGGDGGEEEEEEGAAYVGADEEYDVAVVLTGSNDLKFAILPWMFSAQRREEYRSSSPPSSSSSSSSSSPSSPGEDFFAELRAAVEAVSTRMRAGLRESLGRAERVRAGLRESLDRARDVLGSGGGG